MSSGAAIGGGAGTVIGGFGWRPGKRWSIANAKQFFTEHASPASLDQAGHDDNHVEINGAWLRITARDPDFESPWSESPRGRNGWRKAGCGIRRASFQIC